MAGDDDENCELFLSSLALASSNKGLIKNSGGALTYSVSITFLFWIGRLYVVSDFPISFCVREKFTIL
jgi:hypothetical protein